MGRRKILIRPIADDRNRQVTLNKRKAGLFKKAYELSVLCKCNVALIIFDANGRLYQYSNQMAEVMGQFVEASQVPVESHTNQTMEEWLQRMKKSGPQSDDEHDSDEGPYAVKPEPVGSSPDALSEPFALAAPTKKRPAKPTVVIPPPAAFDADHPGLLRLPSLGLGTALPAVDPFYGALMGSLLPPPSPANPTLHTALAGDIAVSNSMQAELHRQQSNGLAALQRQGSAGLPPLTPGAVLPRQLSLLTPADVASLYASLFPQGQDGLAILTAAAGSAAPATIETADAGAHAHAYPPHAMPLQRLVDGAGMGLVTAAAGTTAPFTVARAMSVREDSSMGASVVGGDDTEDGEDVGRGPRVQRKRTAEESDEESDEGGASENIACESGLAPSREKRRR